MKIKFMFVLAVVLTFSSCKKQTDDTTVFSALAIFNASPSYSTYDSYINDTKINTAALPFGGGLSYYKLNTGSYDVKFTTSGRSESLLTKSVTLNQNYFSLFLINRPTSLDGLLITDDVSATSTTNAFVRFVNLSPDAPAFDAVINGGATIATNKLFKEASTYVSVAAGTYTFDIKDKATGTVKASIAGEVLTAGYHYTIISRGLLTPANANEHPLSAQLIKQQ